MDSIASNLQGIYQRLAMLKTHETPPVTLIAVSKTQSFSAVLAAAQAGQRDFGENYIQEGVDKVLAMRSQAQADSTAPSLPLMWHMIGPIQSNKTRLVAEHFDWVHTIDRLKIAQRLSEQRPANMPLLNVLVQINVDDEPTKSGVLPQAALALCLEVARLPNLVLRGLMCIPEKASRQSFATMATLKLELNAQGLNMDVLSMGMSADFEAAVAQGATHVRVGSAIFGARTARALKVLPACNQMSTSALIAYEHTFTPCARRFT
jgi:PLP dependent protein